MTPEPTRFEKALQRAREQQLRMERQKQLIAVLEDAGQSHLLPEAHRLLSEMTRTYGALSEDLRNVMVVR